MGILYVLEGKGGLEGVWEIFSVKTLSCIRGFLVQAPEKAHLKCLGAAHTVNCRA